MEISSRLPSKRIHFNCWFSLQRARNVTRERARERRTTKAMFDYTPCRQVTWRFAPGITDSQTIPGRQRCSPQKGHMNYIGRKVSCASKRPALCATKREHFCRSESRTKTSPVLLKMFGLTSAPILRASTRVRQYFALLAAIKRMTLKVSRSLVWCYFSQLSTWLFWCFLICTFPVVELINF